MKHLLLKFGMLFFIMLLLIPAAAAAASRLIPVGSTVGLELQTDGILVAEVCEDCKTELEPGDRIISIDGTEISSVKEIHDRLNKGSGSVTLTVLRNGKKTELMAQPIDTDQGKRLGISVRDHIAGIGTVTYVNPKDNTFGALGHGVNEIGSMELLPANRGSVYESTIQSVKKGEIGVPGQLQGTATSTEPIGNIYCNSSHGVFGTLGTDLTKNPALPVAKNSEITTGKATILSNVLGTEVQEYDVEIIKIYPTESDSGRNICLQVTDPKLLELTGGIVQGMSGSPIIQNGKLIGAVTHVFVQNPKMGYGIFIENMLKAGEDALQAA